MWVRSQDKMILIDTKYIEMQVLSEINIYCQDITGHYFVFGKYNETEAMIVMNDISKHLNCLKKDDNEPCVFQMPLEGFSQQRKNKLCDKMPDKR